MDIQKEVERLRHLTKRLKGNPFAAPVPELQRIKNLLAKLENSKTT